MDSKVPTNPQNATKREFLGKTENFKDNQERHFYQRMLKAYLKGKEVFHFGFHDVNRNGIVKREPKPYLVAQKYS